MKDLKITSYLLAIMLALGFTACEDDEATPVRVNFSNTETGISKDASSADVEISFSRPAEADGNLSVQIASTNLTYGEDADFYTSPAASDMAVMVPYTVGDESVTVTISSGAALNIDTDESITLTISDANGILDLGDQTTFTVMFSENFIAPSGTATLDAGGAEFTYQAYFDLSKQEQTQIDKYSWDLGFYSGDDFRVIINNSAKMMAQMIGKNDLTAVTVEDTVGFGSSQSFDAYNGDAVDWVDAPNGQLDSLALNKVSATDSDNKVYIISREGANRNWKKIRVLQNGNGYTLQYANIASSTFETAEITKDETYNFSFFDLDLGATQAEPAKARWDIMYGSFTNVINFGYFLPYTYNDFIIINRYETEVAEILVSETLTYESFIATDANAQTFSSDQHIIGSNWRNGGGPTSEPSLKEDRFYIIKDSEGNTYKLKFTSMYSTNNGERGYAGIAYELL